MKKIYKVPQIKAKYDYEFPLEVISKNDFIEGPGNESKIKKSLAKRNLHYLLGDKRRKGLILKKINRLSFLEKFITNFLKDKYPDRKIINIFSYGSYLYGTENYLPEDIDLGAIVSGKEFDYVINDIKIPKNNKLYGEVETNKINFFIYGRKNLEKGHPEEDNFVEGVKHENAIKREITSSFYRNAVIKGWDFSKIENNQKNILVHAGTLLQSCYVRFYNKSYKNESEKKRLVKISNRLLEAALFLVVVKKIKIDLDALFYLPENVQKNKTSKQEVKSWCDNLFNLYLEISSNF